MASRVAMTFQQPQDLDYSNISPIFLYPTIVLHVSATVFVGLRIYARNVQHLKLQFDDYIVIIALVSHTEHHTIC